MFKVGQKVIVKSFEEMKEEFGVNEDGELNNPCVKLTEEEYKVHMKRVDLNGDREVLLTSIYQDKTPDGDGYEVLYRSTHGGYIHPSEIKEESK